MKKSVLIGIAAIMILASLMAGCEEEEGGGGGNEENLESAPNFSLTSIDGDDFALSNFRGKVVVLDFMYVACTYCDDEMGELKDVYSNYDDNDVVIITIDMLPQQDNETELREFGETYGDDWTYALDTDNVWNDYKDPTNEGVPMIVIINKEGKIAYEHVGLTTYNTLSSEIDKLL